MERNLYETQPEIEIPFHYKCDLDVCRPWNSLVWNYGLWKSVLFCLEVLFVGLEEKMAESWLWEHFCLSLPCEQQKCCGSVRLCPSPSELLLPFVFSMGCFLYLLLGKDYFPQFVHLAVEYYLLFNRNRFEHCKQRGGQLLNCETFRPCAVSVTSEFGCL